MLKPLPRPKRYASSMEDTEKDRLITTLQCVLYLSKNRWSPDKPWDADVLAELSELMHKLGLAPVDDQ